MNIENVETARASPDNIHQPVMRIPSSRTTDQMQENAYLASEVIRWSLATGLDKDEPRNVREAMSGEDAVGWK